jgi:hypothetical protein
VGHLLAFAVISFLTQESVMPAPTNLHRRHLISAALAGAVVPGPLAFAENDAVDGFREPARTLPLVSDADVVVCGAGPAGVSAAITAARSGAKVRLFEWRGCLGGVWTAGLLGYLLDFHKPGFAKELKQHLTTRGYRRGDAETGICYDPEGMKLLLEELCSEAGVQFQLHTKVSAAYLDGRRLNTLVTESKSGREAWQAPVFIDATGDGDLGALAGCGFEFGESAACPCQPMSLNALLVCQDADALSDFVRFAVHADEDLSNNEKKDRFRAEIERTGHFPSYSKPTLWQVRDNLLLVMMNHEYGVEPFDAAAVTAATVRARAELHRIVEGLKGLGGPWQGLQIAATAEQIGVRDGRRIRGRYMVSAKDVQNGARHDDAVTRATFSVDVHAASAQQNKTSAYSNFGIKTQPYDIPLRALIAADVDGLMMAGRAISGDFIAHSSYRVTGNAVSMGEAAGVVAALAAKSGRLPHDVPWSEAAAKLPELARG